jgi:methyl-accepting chemotaxis protein
MKKELQDVISSSQKLLEKVYVELGQNYGQITKTVEHSLKETKSLVEQFKQRISTGDDNILRSLKEIENNVGDVVEGFWTIEKDLDNLVLAFDKSFDVVSNIDTSIEKIKDSSELMEVVALNAMVVAIKSGKNGGGFTFISESLKNNATATIRLTEDILQRGNHVREDFEDLQVILKGLIGKAQELNEYIEKKITARFYQLYQLIEEFVDFLDELYSKATELRKPVYGIMQNLQFQDIMRQSIEHVEMFLEKYQEPEAFESDDDLLDYLATKEFICDFALLVFNEAKEQVHSNVRDFNNALGEIDNKLLTIKDNGKGYYIRHQSLDEEANGISGVLEAFKVSFANLLEAIKQTDTIKDAIENRQHNLFRNIHLLQDKNREFEGLIKIFENIIVLGRIEISKREALKNVDNSMDNIEAVTGRIGKSAADITDAYETIIHTDTIVRDQMDKLFSENASYVNKLNSDVKVLYEYMSQMRDLLFRALDGFDELGNTLQITVGESRADMYLLNKFLEVIENGIDLCSLQKASASKEKRELLNTKGLDRWNVRNKDLHALIEKFTVYRHREQARFLSGLDHDGTSVAEGSVSLF